MSAFFNQQFKSNSILLGKRNPSSASFDIKSHLLQQFSRSHLSTATNSDESRRPSYDYKEEEGNRPRQNYEGLLFGRVSDLHESNSAFAKCYSSDKRFVPAGPRPPVPPVGGLININDAADTINKNQRCLQSISTQISNQQNIKSEFISCDQSLPNSVNNQYQENKQISSSLSTNSSSPSEQISIERQSSYQEQDSTLPSLLSEQDEPLHQPLHLLQNLLDPLGVPSSEEFLKKRDVKASSKAKDDKQGCKGCYLLFHKLKQDGFCHNCYKIYEAVEAFVDLNNGKFEFIEKKCQFKLTCSNLHDWKVDFKTKQVKKWCKICKKKARAQRKEYFKMMDEEEYLKKIQLQNELFNKTLGGNAAAGSYAEDAYGYGEEDDYLFHDHDDHHQHHGHGGHHHFNYQNEEEQKEAERFFAILTGEEGEERQISQEFMNEVVVFIMSQPDYRIQRFLQRSSQNNFYFSQQISQERRMSSFRKVARLVHPDKNSHVLAKEAFQKLVNCSIRSKANQTIWLWYGLLFEAEEVECF